MSEPRRHHIVPAFYLRGFEGADGGLRVVDTHRRKRYTSNAQKVARVKDFYRVDHPAYDRQQMEGILAHQEGLIARFTQAVAADGRADSKQQVGEVLSLAALLMVRTRAARARFAAVISANMATAVRNRTVTQEEWERYRNVELLNGAAGDIAPTLDAARAQLLAGTWFPSAPRELLVGLIPEAQGEVLKWLQRRDWELHITDSSTNGGFITSEDPVVVGNLQERIDGHPASLTDLAVEITFPVSKDTALVSTPGAYNGNVETVDETVAFINTRTVFQADRFIAFCNDDFKVMRRDGNLTTSEDYFTTIGA